MLSPSPAPAAPAAAVYTSLCRQQDLWAWNRLIMLGGGALATHKWEEEFHKIATEIPTQISLQLEHINETDLDSSAFRFNTTNILANTSKPCIMHHHYSMLPSNLLETLTSTTYNTQGGIWTWFFGSRIASQAPKLRQDFTKLSSGRQEAAAILALPSPHLTSLGPRSNKDAEDKIIKSPGTLTFAGTHDHTTRSM
jgi:hypothetical protein